MPFLQRFFYSFYRKRFTRAIYHLRIRSVNYGSLVLHQKKQLDLTNIKYVSGLIFPAGLLFFVSDEINTKKSGIHSNDQKYLFTRSIISSVNSNDLPNFRTKNEEKSSESSFFFMYVQGRTFNMPVNIFKSTVTTNQSYLIKKDHL